MDEKEKAVQITFKMACDRCFWREGSHCFSKNLGDIPKNDSGCLMGHMITKRHYLKCKRRNRHMWE